MGADTLVQGPRREFVGFGSKRIVTDDVALNCFYQVSRLNGIIKQDAIEKSVLEKSRDAAVQERKDAVKDRDEKNAALIKCREEAAGNKAWAMIGKVETVTICVGVAVAGTVAILNAVK